MRINFQNLLFNFLFFTYRVYTHKMAAFRVVMQIYRKKIIICFWHFNMLLLSLLLKEYIGYFSFIEKHTAECFSQFSCNLGSKQWKNKWVNLFYLRAVMALTSGRADTATAVIEATDSHSIKHHLVFRILALVNSVEAHRGWKTSDFL